MALVRLVADDGWTPESDWMARIGRLEARAPGCDWMTTGDWPKAYVADSHWLTVVDH